MIEAAKRAWTTSGVPYDREIKIGGMIEVPAAALALGMFTRKLDFLSIGTNDLIQYTLAIDRTDDMVSHLYDPLHPAVLGLLAHVIKTGEKAKLPVALCGEMAGDTMLTRLLLALGLRNYSMHSAHLLDVKQQILRSNLEVLRPLARKMLRTTDPAKLRSLLEELEQLRTVDAKPQRRREGRKRGSTVLISSFALRLQRLCVQDFLSFGDLRARFDKGSGGRVTFPPLQPRRFDFQIAGALTNPAKEKTFQSFSNPARASSPGFAFWSSVGYE